MNYKPGDTVKYLIDGRHMKVHSVSVTGRFITLKGHDYDLISCKIGKVRPLKKK